MTPFFKTALAVLNDLQIPYCLGADSLVGFSHGDPFEYSHHLRLYLFPVSRRQIIKLSIALLKRRIILKPKQEKGQRYYKIRSRMDPMTKDPTHIRLILLEDTPDGYQAFLGGQKTSFSREDLDPANLDFSTVDDTALSIPAAVGDFVDKYEPALMGAFYQKHDIAFDSKSEKAAVEFMHKNVAVMSEAGIRFWIEGGTLLGALRDGKLIPWDHDLDFGMIFQSEQEMRRLIKKLRKHFYVSVRSFPKTEEIWQLGKYRVLKIFPRKYYLFKEALCLDLFVYYEGQLPGTSESVYKYVVWNRNAYHRKEFFETTEIIQFYGGPVPVPANPEAFIEVKYGSTWRTPIKAWNVALDDGSIYKP